MTGRQDLPMSQHPTPVADVTPLGDAHVHRAKQRIRDALGNAGRCIPPTHLRT